MGSLAHFSALSTDQPNLFKVTPRSRVNPGRCKGRLDFSAMKELLELLPVDVNITVGGANDARPRRGLSQSSHGTRHSGEREDIAADFITGNKFQLRQQIPLYTLACRAVSKHPIF